MFDYVGFVKDFAKLIRSDEDCVFFIGIAF